MVAAPNQGTKSEPHYALNAITMPFSYGYGVASEAGSERLQGT